MTKKPGIDRYETASGGAEPPLRVGSPRFPIARFTCLLLLLATALCAQTPSIDQIQKQAETARQQNRPDDAIKLYKRGVTLKPAWEEGWWALGNIYYGLDNYTEARDAFRHLSTLEPGVGAPWAMLGLCEFETKQYDQAISHLHRGTDLHKGISEEILESADYHLALLLTRSEQYEGAMKILALFAQRNLNDARFVEAMGIASLRKPVLPSEAAPTDRQLIMDVGRVMYDASALRNDEASAEFKILVDKYPETPNIHYLYGSFLLFADADGALAELKKELEISPAHVPALVTIANEYIKRQDYQTGLPYAEQAVKLEPQSFPAHALLGRVCSEGGLDPARGVTELEQAKRLAPGSPQVRIALAAAYAKVGRKEDAARERQEFLKLRKEMDAKEATGPL
jgi:tetratricopeptide (TPR) repeat protein